MPVYRVRMSPEPNSLFFRRTSARRRASSWRAEITTEPSNPRSFMRTVRLPRTKREKADRPSAR